MCIVFKFSFERVSFNNLFFANVELWHKEFQQDYKPI